MKVCPQCSHEFGDEYNFCPEDGTPLAKIVKQQDPLIGKVVNGKYEILEMIREDSLGRTFKARQMPLGRIVILELFNTSLTRDPSFKSRLSEAIRKYSKLQHVNIGTVYDMDETEDNRFFIISEFVEGQPFSALLKSEAPLEQERALNVFFQIADALHQAHSNLIEHGFLTPQDIIIYTDSDGRECVQILNFGISKMLLSEKIRQYHETRETEFLSVDDVAYISPDQASGLSTVDDLDDVYSFGVILYHALTGGLPFAADSTESMIEAHQTLDVIPVKNLPQCKGVNHLWDSIIERCLKKNKVERFQSVREAKVLLQRIGDVLKHGPEAAVVAPALDAGALAATPPPVHVGEEEEIEATQMVPSSTTKKKSPPLAKTFMIHRDELKKYTESPEALVDETLSVPTPEHKEPKATEAKAEDFAATLPGGHEIRLEELGQETPAEAARVPQSPTGKVPGDEERTLYIGDRVSAGDSVPERDEFAMMEDSFDVGKGSLQQMDLYAETVMVTPDMKENPPLKETAMDRTIMDEKLSATVPGKADVGPRPTAATSMPDSSQSRSTPPGVDNQATVMVPQQPPATPPPIQARHVPPPSVPPAGEGPIKKVESKPPHSEFMTAEEMKLRDTVTPPPAEAIPVKPKPAARRPVVDEQALEIPEKKSNAMLYVIGGVILFFIVSIAVVGIVWIWKSYTKAKAGTVIVQSYPDGANIYLDGDAFGKTPRTIGNVEPGPHTLKVAKEGYATGEQTIQIEAGKTVRIPVVILNKLGQDTTGPGTGQGSKTITNQLVDQIAEVDKQLRAAMDQEHYFEPAEECAVYYCMRLLEIDTTNEYAKECKEKLIQLGKEKGKKVAAANNWAQAEKIYGQITQLDPTDQEIQAAYQKVKDQLGAVYTKRQEDLRKLVQKSDSAFSEGRLVTPAGNCAYEYCQQIKQIDKRNKYATTTQQKIKGQALAQIDQAMLDEKWEQAKNVLEAFSRYYPGDPATAQRQERIRQKMADLQQKKMQQDAETQKQQMLEKAKSLQATGIENYKTGNFNGAIENLQQAIQYDPQLAEAYFYLGASYLELKNISKAQEYFKKTLQRKPNHAAAHLNLGILAKAERNYESAIQHLQQVIQLGGLPNYPVSRVQEMVQEIEVQKNFALLMNKSIPAEHKHFIGGCIGSLVFTSDSMRYETAEAKHAVNIPLKDMRGVTFGKSQEFAFQVGGDKYKFNIKNESIFNQVKMVLPEYLKQLR